MNNMSISFELFTNEPRRLLAFYTKILGFEIDYENENYFAIKRDSVRIGIDAIIDLNEKHYFRPEITNTRKGLGVEIVLYVDDIESEYKKIQDSGYHIAEKLQKREWGLTDFRLIDPEGYYLRITSRE